MLLRLKTLIVIVIFWAASMTQEEWRSELPIMACLTLGFGLAWVWVFALIYGWLARRRR